MAGCRKEDFFEFIASASSNLPLILYQLRSNSCGKMADGPSNGAIRNAFGDGMLVINTPRHPGVVGSDPCGLAEGAREVEQTAPLEFRLKLCRRQANTYRLHEVVVFPLPRW